MFGGSRRQRPPNPSLNSTNANPSASMAAAAAFTMSSYYPNKSISSAAAAAALRAHPHTPTNVAEVQTKRTMRRSPSVSSAGSAPCKSAPRLERRGSSGSMTERTFRSPSPHHNQAGQATQQHPPVPAIPVDHRKSPSTSSTGVGMQNFRTASQKMDCGLPSWYTNPTGDLSNVRKSDVPMISTPRSYGYRPASITSAPQRSDSRSSSINFSYPGRTRAQSPPKSPSADHNPQWNSPAPRKPASPLRSSIDSAASSNIGRSDQDLVYDPNSRRMVLRVDHMGIEHHVKEAANKLTRRKKDTGVQRSGSHLAKGTTSRIRGTFVEGGGREREPQKREKSDVEDSRPHQNPQIVEDGPITEAQVMKKNECIEEPRHAQSPELDVISDETVSQAPQELHQRTSSPQASRALGKRPSTVPEESDDEDDEVESVSMSSRAALDVLDAVPTRQILYKQPPEPIVKERPSSSKQSESRSKWNESYTHPDPVVEEQQQKKPTIAENKPLVGLSRENGSIHRSASNSPVRTARFAPGPSDQLAVRHAPPPRSASPIKSALKQSSPSPRGASPSDNASDHSRRVSPHPEPNILRKKSVRVSFDDRSTAVGESATAEDTDSPVVPSTQQTTVKRPWYNNIGKSKKDFTLDDDEIMKPRPALPSFGSVREKKNRGVGSEERALVRPHESAYSPTTHTSPTIDPYSPNTTVIINKTPTPLAGQSSDQGIGSVLAKDQAARVEANISRFREPLPPVVTSLEGNGYVSDVNSLSSNSDEERFDSIDNESDAEAIPSTQTTQTSQFSPPETLANSRNGSMILEDKKPVGSQKGPAAIVLPAKDIPSISIVQPSPVITDQAAASMRSPRSPFFDVPGGFPKEESDDNQVFEKNDDSAYNVSTPVNGIFEPQAEILPSQSSTLPQTTLATTSHLAMAGDNHGDESDSNASIYSDAYEDLSEAEADGFQSLDAVVESPNSKTQATEPAETSRDKPMEVNSPESEIPAAITAQIISQAPETVRNEGDWGQAKSFWRSLTAEKRRQLEREALDDAGADGDREEVEAPVRRLSSRKKTAEERHATAIATKARASASASKPVQSIDPDRVYLITPGSKADHEPVSPTPQGRMRTSMRGDQAAKTGLVAKVSPESTHMRRSMRPNAGTDPGNSRTPRPVTSQSQKPKTSTTTDKRPQINQNRSSSFGVAFAAGNVCSKNPKPTLQRHGSDGSDSSFKRSRAGPPGGAFGFRRTMRQVSGPHPNPEANRNPGRFTLRSLSPAGSPFHRASTNSASAPPVTMTMRRSLRAGSESSQDNRDGRRSSMHLPSFGRSSKVAEPKRTKRGSRLADSSDEDEPTGAGFRSRFEDSSDNDIQPVASAGRTLSKGTLRGSATVSTGQKKPTKVSEEVGESPNLPDTDEESSMRLPSPLTSPQTAAGMRQSTGRTSSGIGTSTLRRQRTGRGTLVTSPTESEVTTGRRSSFMGNLLRRNQKADHAGKIQRSDLSDSAARRDTRLERNQEWLRTVRGDSRASNPRLQKRNQMTRTESWPLPEAEDERPTTSGGMDTGNTESKRPSPEGRRSTSPVLPAAEGLVTTKHGFNIGEQKKKKFGALRRIFRLDG